jgi:excisionase family DNA binding protein
MSAIVLYTAAEVAELLRMNPQVVQRKLQAGEIPGYRIGREWRVEADQLRAWLERHSNQRPPLSEYFDDDGRLLRLPSKQSKRRAVLDRLIVAFEPDRTYAETEVNAILRGFHDDVATLRREMIVEKLFVRTPAGVYKRVSRPESVIPIRG